MKQYQRIKNGNMCGDGVLDGVFAFEILTGALSVPE